MFNISNRYRYVNSVHSACDAIDKTIDTMHTNMHKNDLKACLEGLKALRKDLQTIERALIFLTNTESE